MRIGSLVEYKSQQLIVFGLIESPKRISCIWNGEIRLVNVSKPRRLNECPFMDFKCLPFVVYLMPSIPIPFSLPLSQLNISCVQGNQQYSSKPR